MHRNSCGSVSMLPLLNVWTVFGQDAAVRGSSLLTRDLQSRSISGIDTFSVHLPARISHWPFLSHSDQQACESALPESASRGKQAMRFFIAVTDKSWGGARKTRYIPQNGKTAKRQNSDTSQTRTTQISPVKDALAICVAPPRAGRQSRALSRGLQQATASLGFGLV
jgi:hypothetical protein